MNALNIDEWTIDEIEDLIYQLHELMWAKWESGEQ